MFVLGRAVTEVAAYYRDSVMHNRGQTVLLAHQIRLVTYGESTVEVALKWLLTRDDSACSSPT